jgi:hypothetical protein
MLGQLVAMSTPDQIEVYDKIIGSKSEFSFYSGVVSTMGLEGVAQLKSQNPTGFEQGFKKNSLAWILALARVEVGSTVAMYGKTQTPFADMAPGQFGMREYLSVLFDDLSAHILALSTDEDLKRICKRTVEPDSQTLAYLRRLKLVGDMLKAVEATGNSDYAQRAKSIDREVGKYRKTLATKVLVATTDVTGYSTGQSSQSGTRNRRDTRVGSANVCRQLAEGLVGQTRTTGRTSSTGQ